MEAAKNIYLQYHLGQLIAYILLKLHTRDQVKLASFVDRQRALSNNKLKGKTYIHLLIINYSASVFKDNGCTQADQLLPRNLRGEITRSLIEPSVSFTTSFIHSCNSSCSS